MNYKPELIVFDLAGTTIEDHHDVQRVLRTAMKKYHVSITREEADSVMGLPKPIAIEKLLHWHNHPDITKELILDIHDLFVKSMIDFYRNSSEVKEKAGVSETFEKLRSQNIRVAVDTGFDRPIVNVLLERTGWLRNNLIDASVSSDEVEYGRPYPDLIYKAMQLTGVTDADMVAKVGDTVSDIQEGRFAGCGWVIGITSGTCSHEQLLAQYPSELIESIPELLKIFELK